MTAVQVLVSAYWNANFKTDLGTDVEPKTERTV